jgi:hypothetical protein
VRHARVTGGGRVASYGKLSDFDLGAIVAMGIRRDSMNITSKKLKALCMLLLFFMGVCMPELLFSAENSRSVILGGIEGQKLFDQCSRPAPQGVSDIWIPSVQEVEKMEESLPQFLEKEGALERMLPLGNYYYQYVGYIVHGRRMIYVNAFVGREQAKDWRRKAVLFCDGGSAFFGVEYDVEEGNFLNLYFNGVA